MKDDLITRSARDLAVPAVIAILLLLLGGCGKVPVRQPVSLPDLGLSGEEVKNRLLSQYQDWKGIRYRNGGQSRKGIDCSAFVQITYRQQFGVNLPRTTKQLARTGNEIVSGGLRAGDLILFKTGWSDRHIGMYLGKRSFLHVSETNGVTVSSLADSYWQDHYWQARRVFR